MAQLVVRNLPDEVKERLKRRAREHGRSLEAEVREILINAPAPEMRPASGRDIVAALIRRQREIGVTKEDVDELIEIMAELRSDQRMQDIAKRRR